jgi:hypothetical protein
LQDGAQLSAADYPQMVKEVSCYMKNGMDSVGHYWHMHESTIVAGAIALFEGSGLWSWITQMYNVPLAVAELNVCNIRLKLGSYAWILI